MLTAAHSIKMSCEFETVIFVFSILWFVNRAKKKQGSGGRKVVYMNYLLGVRLSGPCMSVRVYNWTNWYQKYLHANITIHVHFMNSNGHLAQRFNIDRNVSNNGPECVIGSKCAPIFTLNIKYTEEIVSFPHSFLQGTWASPFQHT